VAETFAPPNRSQQMKALLMTLREVVDPSKWGEWVRWVIGGLLFALLTVAGSAIVQAYNFGAEREHQLNEFSGIKDQIRSVSGQVTGIVSEQKKMSTDLLLAHQDAAAAAVSAAAVAKDLADGRARALPRLDRLEDAVNVIRPDLAAIKEAVTDIKETTKRHDDDIQAIRAAVAPRSDPYHSPRGNLGTP
jgi:septation ring formation regulator EzrA